MNFHQFRDEFNEARRQDRLSALSRAHGWHNKQEPTSVEFYRILQKNVLSPLHQKEYGDTAITMYILSSAMERWHLQGKPYVKIWPLMAEKLAHTKLGIQGKYLNIPYGVFEIRLPKDGNPLVASDIPEVRSMMVIHSEGTYSFSGASGRQLSIWFDLGHHDYEACIDYKQPTYGYIHLRICDDETLAETLDNSSEINFATEGHIKAGYKPNRDFYRAVMSLAICTCFFMTNSHDMICADIPNRYQEKYNKAKQDGDAAAVAQIEKKARKSGMGGYNLGREINLPRPITVKGESENNGTSLPTWHQRFSHIRSGHLRLQAHGPKLAERKVIFIEPTVVRAELPPKLNSGFAIKDSLLTGT